MRKLGVLVFACVVFVFNPAFLCGAEPFDFGQADMTAAIAGTWKLTVDDNAPLEFKLELPRPQQQLLQQHSRAQGFIGDAAACATRSFVADADACMDTSKMKLVLVALDGKPVPRITAEFEVNGRKFTRGWLTFVRDDRPVFSAAVLRDGSVTRYDSLEDAWVPVSELVHTR